jgi:hypothetical protein
MQTQNGFIEVDPMYNSVSKTVTGWAFDGFGNNVFFKSRYPDSNVIGKVGTVSTANHSVQVGGQTYFVPNGFSLYLDGVYVADMDELAAKLTEIAVSYQGYMEIDSQYNGATRSGSGDWILNGSGNAVYFKSVKPASSINGNIAGVNAATGVLNIAGQPYEVLSGYTIWLDNVQLNGGLAELTTKLSAIADQSGYMDLDPNYPNVVKTATGWGLLGYDPTGMKRLYFRSDVPAVTMSGKVGVVTPGSSTVSIAGQAYEIPGGYTIWLDGVQLSGGLTDLNTKLSFLTSIDGYLEVDSNYGGLKKTATGWQLRGDGTSKIHFKSKVPSSSVIGKVGAASNANSTVTIAGQTYDVLGGYTVWLDGVQLTGGLTDLAAKISDAASKDGYIEIHPSYTAANKTATGWSLRGDGTNRVYFQTVLPAITVTGKLGAVSASGATVGIGGRTYDIAAGSTIWLDNVQLPGGMTELETKFGSVESFNGYLEIDPSYAGTTRTSTGWSLRGFRPRRSPASSASSRRPPARSRSPARPTKCFRITPFGSTACSSPAA